MAQDAVVYRDTFYRELKAFLKDLIKVFPDDRDMKVISSTLNIAMMDDPNDKIVKGFYKTLLPQEDLIDRRDPAFFYEVNGASFGNDTAASLFNKLHLYWESLNEANRKVVWDYIQVLFLVAKTIFVQNA